MVKICTKCKIEKDISEFYTDKHTISKGGGLTKNNIQALCGPCNSSKGAR